MINRVVIVGRITRDAEVKKTQSGMSVCNFCIAADRKDGADFIDCVAWDKTADIAGYCRKGDIVGVEGRLQTRTYEREGRKNKVTEVVADRVRRLSGRKDDIEVSPEELPF